MKISTKCDYALRAVLELALVQGRDSSNTYEIAKKQNIPKRYLEHLLLALKQAGLVTSFRGKTGGYRLARQPQNIKVGDVVRAIEGVVDIIPKSRVSAKKDVISAVWSSTQAALEDALDAITLEDLIFKKERLEKNLTYCI